MHVLDFPLVRIHTKFQPYQVKTFKENQLFYNFRSILAISRPFWPVNVDQACWVASVYQLLAGGVSISNLKVLAQGVQKLSHFKDFFFLYRLLVGRLVGLVGIGERLKIVLRGSLHLSGCPCQISAKSDENFSFYQSFCKYIEITNYARRRR